RAGKALQIAVDIRDVDLAVVVLVERGGLQARCKRTRSRHCQRGLRVIRNDPHEPVEGTEDVAAHETRNRFATIDDAADDYVACVMRELRDGRQQIPLAGTGGSRSVPRGNIESALHAAPAVIAATLDAVHFLDVAFTNVAKPEFTGRAIETHPPGIAKTPGVDLGTVLRAGTVILVAERSARGERIVGRDPIERRAGGAADVDAKDLSFQRR